MGEAKKGWYPLPFPLRGIAALDSRRQGSELDKRRGVPVAPLAREGDEGLSFAGGAFFALKGPQRAALRDRLSRLRADRAPIPALRKRGAQWVKPELVVGVRHLRGTGALRHATVNDLRDS